MCLGDADECCVYDQTFDDVLKLPVLCLRIEYAAVVELIVQYNWQIGNH